MVSILLNIIVCIFQQKNIIKFSNTDPLLRGTTTTEMKIEMQRRIKVLQATKSFTDSHQKNKFILNK